jgi:gluconolactonase
MAPEKRFTNIKPILFVDGQKFPEGPNFDDNGNLYVCNRWDGFINIIRPDGQYSKFIETGGKPNGCRLHHDGRLFIADIGLRQILAADSGGRIDVFVDNYQGAPLLGPNDMVFDRNGILYFTDPGLESKDLPGQVFRYTPDGTLSLLSNELFYPNGIALSKDERSLFVAETGTDRISRYEIDNDGTLKNWEIFIQFEEESSSKGFGPDGIAFDIEENLYVAHRGSGNVIVINPEGRIIARIPSGGDLPTNMAFRDTSLYVTEDDTEAVYRLDIGVKGLPLYHQMENV